MARLTHRNYWDSVWEGERPADVATGEPKPEAGPARESSATKEYSEHVLFNVLYKAHIPAHQQLKVLEVGSAPGTFLVKFSRAFGTIPYGVEYTERGAQLNRVTFAQHGHDPDHVIHADFFSDEFQKQYRGFFDVVISRGFMEHFTDIDEVIRKHIALVKPGGRLVIAIPRFRGVYWAWMRLFDRDDLARHNLTIMDKEVFTRAFEGKGLETRYCGYYGAIALKRFVPAGSGRLVQICRRMIMRGALVADAGFKLFVRAPGIRSSLLSPYLIFIGTRTPDGAAGLGRTT